MNTNRYLVLYADELSDTNFKIIAGSLAEIAELLAHHRVRTVVHLDHIEELMKDEYTLERLLTEIS